MKVEIELEELQALFASGMSHLGFHYSLMLKVTDANAASAALRSKLQFVHSSAYPAQDNCYQIAFTYSGLKLLVDDSECLSDFSFPFVTGAHDKTRVRRLKDDMSHWVWGSDEKPVDVWVGIYSSHPIPKENLELPGFKHVAVIEGSQIMGREHFGFRDGMSQPHFLPFHKKKDRIQDVAAGEFVFGFEDETKGIFEGPHIGKHGSYLVVRQLQQDVEGFWDFVNHMAKRIDLSNINLAEKMIGRRMNGYAIGRDQKTKIITFKDDKLGTKCPLGSHVRRANPRESASDNEELAIQKMKRHRMVRRGRPYGPPALNSWYPTEMQIGANGNDERDAKRGLLFMSLQADIERQFELVLHDWLQNPKFAGLADDIDPITHNDFKNKQYQKDKKYFSIPREGKVPIRIPLQTFVITKGAGYFFIPGINALKRILKRSE